jgi:hypothetical protein
MSGIPTNRNKKAQARESWANPSKTDGGRFSIQTKMARYRRVTAIASQFRGGDLRRSCPLGGRGAATAEIFKIVVASTIKFQAASRSW